jgi:hypothetical protein
VQRFPKLSMEVPENSVQRLDTAAVHDLLNRVQKLTHDSTLAKYPGGICPVER